ncbi:MAG TPA: hypothetical protein VK254_04490 [Candidatus Bathyarchaeia archaeon]|nr:hypothetical protein [Candidatus Bathyarchaeia archaeon]
MKETERKIYQKEENADSDGGSPDKLKALNPHAADEEPFSASSFGPADLDQKKEVWIKEQEEKKAARKKILKIVSIGLGAVILAAGIIWLAMQIRKSAFSEAQVKVSISGPEKVKSGESVSFDINYQNLNRASLTGAVLYINYSENFKPSGNLQFESEGPSTSKFNIGTIAAKSNGKITIQGKFFGAQDALVYLEAKLDYKPSTFNSTFEAKGNANVFISSSPLVIEMSGPQNAAAGNAVSYTVKYQNTGQEDFNDLKIKAEYPDGFSYVSSDPMPAQDNDIWYVGKLAAGQTGQVKVNGTVNGTRDEEKTVKFSIGQIGSDNAFISYGETQSSVKIIGSPLVISETINGKKEKVFANASDALLFKIDYQNTGSIGLRDLILSVEANSPMLDYSRIDMSSGKGEFDADKKIVTWKASDIPDFKTLAPGAQGSLTFSISVKDIIPVSGMNDKNFAFSAVARMDSPDIPTPEGANKIVASNAVDVKLNSKLLATLQGFFNDADIQNSGPLPPKVGQESTFTMHLKIANVSNDVTDAKVVMTLAPGVTWKNNFLPRDASMSNNSRTNELVWNVGSVSAGTGVITDPKELIFQLGLTPSQAGDFAPLVSQTVFSAKDSFTGQPLEAKIGPKNTNFTEDLGVGEMGKVSP